MAFKKRTTGAITGAKVVGLGAAYGRVQGYNVLSSADTSVSIACVDADGKTIFTEASADFTNTTGKDGVERVLTAEAAVTEDGTSATANAGFGPGVWAKSPLTITPAGVGTGTVTVDVYVEV
jgi:hypothetical protein